MSKCTRKLAHCKGVNVYINIGVNVILSEGAEDCLGCETQCNFYFLQIILVYT